MVFGSGNRLLDKQLAEKGQARGGTLVAPQCELCWEVTEVVCCLNVRCSLVLHALSSPNLARPSGVAWTACDRLHSTCASSNLMLREQTNLGPSMKYGLAQVECNGAGRCPFLPLVA